MIKACLFCFFIYLFSLSGVETSPVRISVSQEGADEVIKTAEQLVPQVVAIHPHDASCFTQGLIVDGDVLFESSGLYGCSRLRKSHLQSGQILKETFVPKQLFAEGIALHNGRIFLLTWKEQKALLYDANSLELKGEIPYMGEGWGLCQDGSSLWMSDGSSRLFQRSTDHFQIQKILWVKHAGQPCGLLNDLICVEDQLYGNVWGKEIILRIDKHSGEVTGIVDASGLLSQEQKMRLTSDSVMNGLAYRKEKQTFLVTGKHWPSIFEVRFIHPPSAK